MTKVTFLLIKIRRQMMKYRMSRQNTLKAISTIRLNWTVYKMAST